MAKKFFYNLFQVKPYFAWTTNSFIHAENVFRRVHCRTRKTQLPIRYSVFRHARALPVNTEQRRPPTATFPTTMLSLSWINLPDISISGLINPGSENIVQILVATFTLLALLPRSFYFQSILCDRLKLRLAAPKFMTSLPHSIYHSVAKCV